MSSDFLSDFSELENKIEVLLLSLEEARDENAILKQSSDLNAARIAELESQSKEFESKFSELEGENQSLKQQVETLTADLEGQREKIAAASERVKGLLTKFDAGR